MGNKQSRKVDFSKFEANPSAPKNGYGAYDMKVIETINVGGFGVVSKIRRFHDNKLFALKKSMMKDISKNDRLRYHDLLESKLGNLFDHPFIAKVVDNFMESEYWYIVLELANKGDLQMEIN